MPRPVPEFCEEAGEISAREGPLEELGRVDVTVLKAAQAILDGRERWEVVGREDFALDDREVDLDLVQPTGVDGRVHEHNLGSLGLEPHDGALTTMGRGVVHDPKDPTGGAIGFLVQDVGNEALKGGDARLAFTPPEYLGPMHVPGGEGQARAHEPERVSGDHMPARPRVWPAARARVAATGAR